MRKLNEQEARNIKVLTRYPEWQTFLALLVEFKATLTDLKEIDQSKSIEAQVLGRIALLGEFNGFMNNVDIASQPEKQAVDRTYE